MAVAPGTLLGRYHIISPLGAGGMGEVYLAQDTQLGRRVAIKFPTVKSDEHHAHARFLREARAVSVLSHSHIATIYDYGQTPDGQPYLVMELVEGQSLSDLMYEGSLTLKRALNIVIAITEALHEAHRMGVIHRDIKPSNVMINERGDVKVLDFGLAKQLHEEPVGVVNPDAQTLLSTRTQSGIVVGTPLYLSPEQATSEPVDARSDIFALGALLYECITGKCAFAGKGVIELTAQIIHIDPPAPSTISPGVPPELDEITLKALAKKPEARYQSAEEMLSDLRQARALFEEETSQHTRRIARAHSTAHNSALRNFSDILQQPRLSLSIGRLLLVGLSVGIIAYLLWAIFLRPQTHVPPKAAQDWYDTGTNAMREGAYDKAAKAFQRAIEIDDLHVLAHARLAEAWYELDYSGKAKDEMLRINNLVPDRSALSHLDALYLQAVSALASRNLPLAIKSYTEIAKLTPEQAYVYLDLGRAYEKNDETDKAIENYLEATRRDGQYALAYLRLGALYGRKMEGDRGLAVFETAENLYSASSNYEGVTEVYFHRGVLYNKLEKPSEANAQLQKALENSRLTRNLYQQVRVLLQLGIFSRKQGDNMKAKELAMEALELARANGLETLTAQCLNDLGNVCLAREEFAEAEKYFRQALDSAQRHGGLRNEARAKHSLGSMFVQHHQPEQAVAYAEDAARYYQQGGYRREASQSLQLISRAHQILGNYNASLTALKEALKLSEEVNDQPQISQLHGELGLYLSRLERYPEALDHFTQNSESIASSKNKLNKVFNLLNRGNMLWRLGRQDEARPLFTEALGLADRPGEKNIQLMCDIFQSEALLALSRRKFPEAIAQSKRVLNLESGHDSHHAVKAKLVIGLAQLSSGSKVDGEHACQEAVEMAKKSSDPQDLSLALLALAEAQLANGKAAEALNTARETYERFAGADQIDSAWRALLFTGLANQQLNNLDSARENLSRASELLSSLRQKWGAEHFQTYLSRPDIQGYQQKLEQARHAVQ